jgi:hypothetical protein
MLTSLFVRGPHGKRAGMNVRLRGRESFRGWGARRARA